MKKYALLIIAACMPLCLLSACTSEDAGSSIDEADSLDAVLMQVYDLVELENFIKPRNANVASLAEFDGILYYDELNAQFPVEVIRYGDDTTDIPYTVYKVSGGGYYFVFWSWAYPKDQADALRNKTDAHKNTEYMCVYFSAYIGANKSILDFMSLKPGTSTAEDVRKIDADFDYVSLSRGRFSYSLLNDKKVLEIKYTHKNTAEADDIFSFEDLVVQEVKIISIDDSPSCYRLIWQEDFP